LLPCNLFLLMLPDPSRDHNTQTHTYTHTYTHTQTHTHTNKHKHKQPHTPPPPHTTPPNTTHTKPTPPLSIFPHISLLSFFQNFCSFRSPTLCSPFLILRAFSAIPRSFSLFLWAFFRARPRVCVCVCVCVCAL